MDDFLVPGSSAVPAAMASWPEEPSQEGSDEVRGVVVVAGAPTVCAVCVFDSSEFCAVFFFVAFVEVLFLLSSAAPRGSKTNCCACAPLCTVASRSWSCTSIYRLYLYVDTQKQKN